jgi:N-glycosylase/DNA lyase
MQIKLDLETTPFNIDFTLRCGQVFRWRKENNIWYGVINNTCVKMTQRQNILTYSLFPDTESTLIHRYLRFDDNLPTITKSINKDAVIRKTLTQLEGLRLVRQDPWECLISFICATFANIPRTRRMVHNLCRTFGQPVAGNGYTEYLFPSPQKLAYASINQLIACNLGYRAKYVKAAATRILEGAVCLPHLRSMPYLEAKQELLRIEGIGHKVADCVLLFSLEHLKAFPVDRWLQRILITKYPQHLSNKALIRKALTPQVYKELSSFGQSYFGNYAGYAQEYLYAYHSTIQMAGCSLKH